MLEAIGAGSSQQMGGQKDWADRWLESEEHQANQREIEVLKRSSSAQRLDDPESDHVRATSCELVHVLEKMIFEKVKELTKSYTFQPKNMIIYLLFKMRPRPGFS